jgi:hypothetical protein
MNCEAKRKRGSEKDSFKNLGKSYNASFLSDDAVYTQITGDKK